MKARQAASAVRRRRILASARRRFGAGDDFPAVLLGSLFGRVSVEDLEPYVPAEVAGFASSAATLLEQRVPGQPKICISDPEFGPHGHRHQAVTLVEMLNDNMPFLVDSIMAELQDFGAEIRLVAHPVVTVTRDGRGRLKDFRRRRAGRSRQRRDPRKPDARCMSTGCAAPRRATTLARQLELVLTEVRRAVDGWQTDARRGCRRRSTTTGRCRRRCRRRKSPRRSPSSNGCSTTTSRSSACATTISSAAGRRGELVRAEAPGLGILCDPDVRVLKRGAARR